MRCISSCQFSHYKILILMTAQAPNLYEAAIGSLTFISGDDYRYVLFCFSGDHDLTGESNIFLPYLDGGGDESESFISNSLIKRCR